MTQATEVEAGIPQSRNVGGGATLLGFFLLAFALTWSAWVASGTVPVPGTSPSLGPSILRDPLFLLGVFAPGIVALVHRAVTGTWPHFGETPWFIMTGALLVSTWAQAGEEVGWRGYALPRLAARIGLAPASIRLGVIWAVWHLPLFFAPQTETYGQSFPVYLLQVTALSIAMAWLYWRTGGSLLLVMLLHAAVNNTKDIVPSAVPGATNPFAPSTSLVAWLTGGCCGWAPRTSWFGCVRRNRGICADLRSDSDVRETGT